MSSHTILHLQFPPAAGRGDGRLRAVPQGESNSSSLFVCIKTYRTVFVAPGSNTVCNRFCTHILLCQSSQPLVSISCLPAHPTQIADTPFPFPWAQFMIVVLLAFTATFPLLVAAYVLNGFLVRPLMLFVDCGTRFWNVRVSAIQWQPLRATQLEITYGCCNSPASSSRRLLSPR